MVYALLSANGLAGKVIMCQWARQFMEVIIVANSCIWLGWKLDLIMSNSQPGWDHHQLLAISGFIKSMLLA